MINDTSYFSRSTSCYNNESGRSLIEMLGTIAIITMITVGAISGANVGMSMWKAAQTKEDVMGLIVGIQDLYSWDRDGIPNGEGATWSPNLCDQDLIDRECDKDNRTWTSAFGTDITVSSSNNVITVTVKGVPAMACKQFGADGKIITEFRANCPTKGNAESVTFIHDPDAVQ